MAFDTPMGLGKLGGASLVHKRKFRWLFEVQQLTNGDVPPHFVKIASRPNLSIEETEINFLNGKTWIPGKASWETITITFYDVATDDNIPLWSWLATVYNFLNPVTLEQASRRDNYAGVAVLTLYDGCGKGLERWSMGDAWPQAVNFGELDYSSSEEVTIEVTLRYSNVSYVNLCGSNPTSNCQPCVAGGSGQLLFAQAGGVQNTPGGA